jgi:hypothetical protein
MGITQQIGASSIIKPGVIDNTAARPASPYEGQMVYEKDTDMLAIWNGTAWRYIASTTATSGSVLQVQSTTLTTIFSATIAPGASADITGLSVSITPKSTSSKVLVMVNMHGMVDVSGSYRPYFAAQLKRGATLVGGGTVAGSRTSINASGGYTPAPDLNANISFSYMDSPLTTSATTYQVAAFSPFGGTYSFVVNQCAGDTNASTTGRPSSTITVMEIAG